MLLEINYMYGVQILLHGKELVLSQGLQVQPEQRDQPDQLEQRDLLEQQEGLPL